MKMKFTLLSILSLLIFSSCSKQPECDNEETIALAKELIIQELIKGTGLSFGMDESDKKIFEDFVNEHIEIINARPTEKDDELRRCDCSSQISFKFSEELMEKLKENSFWMAALKKQFTDGVNLDEINNYEAKLDKVTIKDLQDIAIKYLTKDKVIGVLMPESQP